MKLGILANNTCLVCGSDTLGASIGCGCMQMMNKATFIALAQNNEASLEYNYGIKMKKYLQFFMADYEAKFEYHNGNLKKMFRSEFNRSFYPSLYSFAKEKGYCSKKQLDIIIKRFSNNFDLFKQIEKEIETEKNFFLKNFEENNFKLRLEIARNLWKQRKQK